MQYIIQLTLYILTALIPLIFTPTTSELFEFPKFLVLLSGTLVIIAAWIIDYSHTHKLNIKLNLVSYAALGVLATQTLATIFSIHPYTSFWGYYSRFHGGLLTTICYTIIYFAATTWLDTKSTQKIINISVRTAIFIGLIAVLEHFDLAFTCSFMTFLSHIKDATNPIIFDTSCWGLATNPLGRSFATIGQPNWLAAYLIPNIFLAMYLFKTSRKPHWVLQTSVYALLTTAVLFTRSRSAFIALVVSYLTYWLLQLRHTTFTHLKKSFVLASGVVFLVSIFIGTPYTSPLTSRFWSHASDPTTTAQGSALETGIPAIAGGTESGDIRKIVWSGALKLIEKYPLLGTGPETFAYTYYWARPLAHNLTSEWDFLYNKAHNEYLNIAAGAGLVGLLAYLCWHAAMLYTSLESDLYPVLAATLVSFTITNFFGFSVVPVYFIMILVSALTTSISQTSPTSITTRPQPGYLLILLVLIYPLRLYLADLSYASGKRYLDAGSSALALPHLMRAESYRPGLDLYHATLAETYALLGKRDLALSEIDKNRSLNPYHLNFYKSRAKAYLTLASLDPKYHVQAAAELETARKLAPTDPKLAYNLGLVYTRLDKLSSAEQNLQAAINLKPNYIEPYYALTLLYEQDKKLDLIPDLLKSAKNNLATYSAQLKDKIDKYVK